MTALTFAICTDLHFGPPALYQGKLRKLSAEAPALLGRFVERMNQVVAPDFIVNLGDDIEDESEAADRARYADVMRILGSAVAPTYHVAGNHDTVHLGDDELVRMWGRTGPLHYTFERAGVTFVVLHTRERKDRDVTVGEAQLAWLAGVLDATPGEVIVFMHHAAADQDLVGNRWFEGHSNICLVQERKAIRALFEKHGRVSCVFNGHLHWNHVDFVGGVPYVTVQSLIENLDDDAPGRPANAHAVVRLLPRYGIIDVHGEERVRVQFARK